MSTTASQIHVRRAEDRFHSDHGWLNSWHTFSFADHYDPAFAGFESLRVINDDTVAPKMGFGSHPHRDMEIISYVISGQLAHKDSLGNGRTIEAGEFQYMSAGSGVVHSEFNPSSTDPVHFLQIWIVPAGKGTEPRYAERKVTGESDHRGLKLIASPNGRDGSIAIHQQAELHHGKLEAGKSETLKCEHEKHWLHLISGEIEIAGKTLRAGDGAALSATTIDLSATSQAEFLLFHL